MATIKPLWNSAGSTQEADPTADTLEGGLLPDYVKHITIVDPTSTDNFALFKIPYAITVTSWTAVITGGTNCTLQIQHSTDRSSGTPNNVGSSSLTASSTTTGSAGSVAGDPTIPANSWVWVDVSAVSGAVTQLEVTLTYSVD